MMTLKCPWTAICCLIAVGLLAACWQRSTASGGSASRDPSRTDTSLVGTWHLTLQLTQTGGADHWPSGAVLEGQLQLHRPAPPAPYNSDVEGRARLDIRDMLETSPPSDEVATQQAADMIRLDIGRCITSARGMRCFADAGTLWLKGRLYGTDSAAGIWGQEFYCCGARGTFVLRRVP